MNKEKMLQFLSEAIDAGAYITILHYGNGVSKEEAKIRTQEFSEIIGGSPIEEIDGEGSTFNKWFSTEKNHTFKLSHFYEVKTEEEAQA